MRLTVGTRGSRLSLIQTTSILETLKKKNPHLTIETKIIQTIGDKLESAPLQEISGKGVFEKEIDEAIVNGEVDFAVHSMKDVPADQPRELIITAIPKRASSNDILISKSLSRILNLPHNATVGTSSPRRIAELLRVRPDLKAIPIRGNVDTRIRKLDAGAYDAIILAEAGITRLGMAERIVERLPIEDFTPTPGQGCLAITARRDQKEILKILESLNDPESWAEAMAERSFMNQIGGGCKIPLGAIAEAADEELHLLGSVISPDGIKRINIKEKGKTKNPEALGKNAADKILQMGAREIIQSWIKS